MFVTTLWCIWKQINEKLLNDAEICHRLTVQVTHDTLLQCQRIQNSKTHGAIAFDGNINTFEDCGYSSMIR